MNTLKKLCACGCGTDITGSSFKVVRGHAKNLLPEFCACGCGQRLEHKSASSGYVAKFVRGHNDAYKEKSKEERRRILAPGLKKATEAHMKLRKTDPEWCEKDSKAKSEGQKNRWASASKTYRKEHGAISLRGMSKEGKKRFQGSKPWSDKRKMEFSLLLKKYHANLSPERKQEISKKLSKAVRQAWKDGKLLHTGVKSWYHTLPSGRRILVQSSWEAATAEVLERVGAKFSRGGQITLVDHTWRPDFLVNDNLYLEVKGHPLAKAQFDRCQLPELYVLDKAVTLVEFCPNPDEYTSLKQLLDRSRFVHTP